ncbi:uncharacterized protein LOC134283179 [Saccostrea cucullata]|uniref:uncharacterized protein LOC134283179 n=1 Tax=Saccostrea cuccullata TaxID=36930 RepID=UPI002ED50C37
MDFEPRQSTGNKRKRSGEEECEFEEKKPKLQSDTDLNGSLQPSIYHGKEIFVQQAFKIQPIIIESKYDDQQERGNKEDLASDCIRERGESFVESNHSKEILSIPVEILSFGSETTSSTNLTDVKEVKDGNCIEHAEGSKKIYIPIEVRSTNNFESENKIQAKSPKYIEKQFGNLSKESSPIFLEKDSNIFDSKTESTTSLQLHLPKNKEDEVLNHQGEASQVSECDERSLDSGILGESESLKNYDSYIEKDDDTNVSEPTLIVKEIFIEENGPTSPSHNQTGGSDDVIGSLEKNDDETKNRNDPDDKKESENYLYRLLRPAETYITGIFPKNIHSSTSLEDHVSRGSSCSIASKFISCSKSLDKIKEFARIIRKGWRHELRYIVRIDRTLMGTDVEEIDLTDTSIRETRLTSERSRRNSLRFEEIILVPKECIPAASVKRIGHVQNGFFHFDE